MAAAAMERRQIVDGFAMTRDLEVVDFRALSKPQFEALGALKVSKRQEVLGKSFLESIRDWKQAPKDCVLGVCFLKDGAPVGLALFRRNVLLRDNTVSIHGLKIALPWQGRGYGHRALGLAIGYLRSEWPEARVLKLAVDADNAPAIAVYQAYGMRDIGPVFDGSRGQEHHMELWLGD